MGLLSYGLAIAGLVAVAIGVWRAWAMSMAYARVHLQLINLLRTQPHEAERWCLDAKGTFLEPLGAALKTASQLGITDPKQINAATRPTFDAQAQAVSMVWKAAFDKAKMGAGAGLGGLVVHLVGKAKGFPYVLVGITALILVGLGYILFQRSEVERQIVWARAQILPEVDRVFVEGRYSQPAAR